MKKIVTITAFILISLMCILLGAAGIEVPEVEKGVFYLDDDVSSIEPNHENYTIFTMAARK
jgi:hypothetical protein